MLQLSEAVWNLKHTLLIKLFINTVLISEFLAPVSHASSSLLYPASQDCRQIFLESKYGWNAMSAQKPLSSQSPLE
jgi:hypothetical protein